MRIRIRDHVNRSVITLIRDKHPDQQHCQVLRTYGTGLFKSVLLDYFVHKVNCVRTSTFRLVQMRTHPSILPISSFRQLIPIQKGDMPFD
jgi:hypothetical protein